uniref:G-protein coupled receptors family 3 profile domain-containing protein n=1 Tax=Leptocylindrus danicus TaxID=163516 RepID=A0A7S2KD76_9STRA
MTNEGISHCAVLLFLQRRCALYYGITNGALLDMPYDMYKNFLGVAALPGSKKILDRSTGKLKECTIDTCPHSIYQEGLGLVNYAPAWGPTNWVGAVHAGKGQVKKQLMKEFFALVGRDSMSDVILNTTVRKLIPNPHRRSHLVVDDWLAKGYDEEFAESYITAYESTESLNVAKYPPVEGSLKMIVALESVVYQYVNSTRGYGNEAIQSKTEAALKTTLEAIIDDTGRDIIFSQYEKYLDVYKEPSTDQYLNNGLRVYGLCLSGAVLLTSFGIVAWMRKYRNEYVVIHSQPQVLKVALCGSVLMGAAIVPRSLDDKWLSIENCNAMCILYPWVYFVGLGTMLSALFSKIERIILIHEKPNEGLSLHVSFDELKKSFIFAVVPNVLILLVWTIFRPNHWERSSLDDDVDEFASAYPDTVGRCVGDDANYTIVYFVLLLYNFCISFAQCLRLYNCTQNQKVSLDNFEDKWIASAIMVTFEFWLIGLPVLLLMADNYSYDYFVEVSLFALTALSSLAFLFVPKFFYLRDKLRNRGPFAEGVSSEQGYKIRSDDPNKFLRTDDNTDGGEGLLFRSLSLGYNGVDESDNNDELRKRLIVLEEENRNMKHAVDELEERETEAIPPSMFSQVTT